MKVGSNLALPLNDEEDDATIAAIDKGLCDADAGRVTPIEEVERMLLQWISKSSPRPKF